MSQDWPKTDQKLSFLKRRIEQKKSLSKFHILGLYAVYGVCAILVLQNLGIASLFSDPCVITSFFPPSNFGYEFWAKIGQKLIKSCHFWKEELSQKKRTF